jgi:amidase
MRNFCAMGSADEAPDVFRLEEATIEKLHEAITSGSTTFVEVVERYIARVRAYNGVCSKLVTEDDVEVPEAVGTVRGHTAIIFPKESVKASAILPDLDKYKGPPIEYGRMERTASDPEVQQQFGMIVGVSNAGHVNALATLNIRGQRSVTCKGAFDLHPSKAALPPPFPGFARTCGGVGVSR